jgi:hypothetical protein
MRDGHRLGLAGAMRLACKATVAVVRDAVAVLDGMADASFAAVAADHGVILAMGPHRATANLDDGHAVTYSQQHAGKKKSS